MTEDDAQVELQEWTKGTRSRTGGSNRVTIYQNNRFGISNSIIKEYFSHPGVRLFYSDDTDVIGLKPSELDDNNAYKIRRKGGDSKAIVSAISFLNHLDREFSETKDYYAEWDEDQGMLLVKLNQPLTDG